MILQKNWIDCINDQERIDNCYKNYTISEFWDWWADGKERIMEIRIKKNFSLIKQIAQTLNIPKSASGVYVKNSVELKEVIKLANQSKTTIWYCPQPKKKNYIEKNDINGWYINNKYKEYAGDDHHVSEIAFLFLDIDRIIKNDRCATNEELVATYKATTEIILNNLGEQDWKDYCVICSGNGIQVLVKLDVPIKIPECEFDIKTEMFIETNEYKNYKELIRKGIGAQLSSLLDKNKIMFGCEIDNSVFKLSMPAALPNSKNFKYDTFRWRGIVYMNKDKNIINEGFADYCYKFIDDIKQFKKDNLFTGPVYKIISAEKRIKPGQLMNNPLVQLMMNNDFPNGGINNTLWCHMKCLLRDSNFNLQSEEFLEFYRYIKRKHRREFTLNYPSMEIGFNESVINNCCIKHLIPPPYTLWEYKNKNIKLFDFTTFSMNDIKYCFDKIELKHEDILDNMKAAKEQLKIIPATDKYKYMLMLVKSLINKYGLDKTKFYVEHAFDRFFNYD
jgi:hypothetical protein